MALAGGYAFQGLVIAAFVVCCGCCLFTSDAISWERREGTLGFLFLTRVRGPDVVIGKLTSAALVNVCALMAFLPVLMIPVLSGGVTGGEAFRKGLVLLDTLFLALAAGLWASAKGFDAFKTARAAVGVVLTILLLPWATSPFGSPPYTVAAFSPLFGLKVAGDLTYRVSPAPFWISIVVVHVLAWLLVLWAGVRLRKSLQEPECTAGQTAPGTSVGATSRVPPARFTNTSAPISWLVQRQRGLRALLWSAVLVGLVSFVARMFPFRFFAPTMVNWVAVWPTAFASTILTGCLFAWAASRFFVEARKTNELELLVTTPVGAKTIVSEQWNVLRRMLRWPLLVMLLPFLFQPVLMMFSHGGAWLGMSGWPWVNYLHLLSIPLSAVNTVLGVFALCWLGMWFGFKSSTQTGAIVRSVTWAKVAPYFFGLCCSLVFNLIPTGFGRTLFPGYLVVSWLPQIITLVFYLWLIKRVKRRLLGELRDTETASLVVKTGLGFWNRARTFQRANHWAPL